jgi:hypothetical protein
MFVYLIIIDLLAVMIYWLDTELALLGGGTRAARAGNKD